jgi:ribosome-binding factor A
MAGRRIERLNEQLKRELASLLQTRVRDPRVGSVTVTGVRTAPDLTLARVAVRLGGDPAARREALAGLEAASPFLRRTLGQELRIRRVPELEFQEDASLERAARIDQLLAEVRPEGGWEEPGPADHEGDDEPPVEGDDDRAGDSG